MTNAATLTSSLLPPPAPLAGYASILFPARLRFSSLLALLSLASLHPLFLSLAVAALLLLLPFFLPLWRCCSSCCPLTALQSVTQILSGRTSTSSCHPALPTRPSIARLHQNHPAAPASNHRSRPCTADSKEPPVSRRTSSRTRAQQQRQKEQQEEATLSSCATGVDG